MMIDMHPAIAGVVVVVVCLVLVWLVRKATARCTVCHPPNHYPEDLG